MKITKMHGLGNSQILVEDLDQNLENSLSMSYNEMAEALCNPNFGVGADQTLIILPSEEADFQMRVFNKNGSEAEMCGNGIRCVAKYLFDKDKVNEKLKIETKAGIKNLQIIPSNEKTHVKVNMEEGELLEENKKVEGFEGSFISVGNPHFVIFTNKATKELAREKGPGLENAEEFQPAKANIEFANPISKNRIETYVWERGAGLTLACGTGACATAFAAKKKGLIEKEAEIVLLGGPLEIKIDDQDQIFMKGPAEYILDGEVQNPREIYSHL